MRRAAPVLLGMVLALLAIPAIAGAAPTGRLLVSVKPPADGVARAAAARAVIARNHARPTGRDVPQVGLVTVRPRAGESLQALARRLRRDPAVRSVAAEHRATLRLSPTDPAFNTADPSPSSRGESLQWWAIRSNFPAAWDLADGDTATVAIIDSGADATHPELAGRIRRSVDLDGDPTHGPPSIDENGHGTHVASLACGIPNNGTGLAGAGLNCGLIVEKSDLSDSSVIRALVDATDHGADVISMSIGTDDRRSPPQAMIDAIDYAYDRGVVLVAAAADKPTTEQGDPANILQPTGTGSQLRTGKGLTVTAADFNGGRAAFAGSGSQISLAAYGAFDRPGKADGILGAFPQPTTEIERGIGGTPCRCRAELAGDSRYAFLEGTSMATPIVAGAAALVRDLNPDLGPADVIRVLKSTAQRPPGTGWTNDLGWGIVDARAALAAAATMDRRAPSSTVRAPVRARGRTIALDIQANDTAAPGIAVAGVNSVRVYRSTGNGRPRRIASTSHRRLRVPVKPGRRYSFYTQAIDKAGNVERAPGRPDARTRVYRAR